MSYSAELSYFSRVLEKIRVRTRTFRLNAPLEQQVEHDLRPLLESGNLPSLQKFSPDWIRPNTIYKLTDPFFCQYAVLLLPDAEEELLVVGPYLLQEISRNRLLEQAEAIGIPAGLFSSLETRFASIPVLRDTSAFFALLTSLGELLWGGDSAFSIVDMEQDVFTAFDPRAACSGEDPEDALRHVRDMEARYEFENKLLDTVANGLPHRAEFMMRNFSMLAMEQRVPDPLRNTKNYVIVCNTLMRKAAERGGVHPIHLDRISSGFARKVESLGTPEEGMELIVKMTQTYCRLVRHHATMQYSPLVQKVIAVIDTDLTCELNLHTLALLHNINSSYLSTLFRKETGKTLTEYITTARLDAAAKLLKTTSLQIQTVAQHCGISDVNYFSKLFRRHFGIAPKQFREQNYAFLPKRT